MACQKLLMRWGFAMYNKKILVGQLLVAFGKEIVAAPNLMR